MSRATTLARLLDGLPHGAWVGEMTRAGDAPARVLAANAGLRRLLGCDDGAPDADVQPFAAERFTDPAARGALIERLAADGAVADHVLRLRRLDGSALWVEVTARAEPVRRGAVLRVDALVRDVSQRRKLDDQSKELYLQLLQAEKMAALGQTISGVAHELNNPLATILTWAERIAERPLDDTAKRGMGVILGETERAARIVRNLLTFARKRQSTRAMIDVNDVVRETLTLRAYEQKVSGIEVTEALASCLPQVFADAHQIQQVLLNLVINAEQAMLGAHGRGTLVVRTWHNAAADLVALEVSDDGPGLPADTAGKVFDPFFTTKEVGQGTGLGLTVAYAIVEEHGGRIRVSPDTSAGATFVVELPVSGMGAGARPRAAVAPPMEAVRGASVLVVEDESALATAVIDALTDAGLHVDYAGDGDDALARIRSARYDAVVCDLKMPRVDGITFYRALAATAPTLARRVIFVTGDVLAPDAERFLEESGCRWLAKPFRLSDLLRAVRETVG
jgi:signal transduction histidine kinase/BarA-like signal transduction histidine kinase